MLQILNGPEEYVASSQIYNQHKFLFGGPKSVERKKVKNHRDYLVALRKSNPLKFESECEIHGVALRAVDQDAGEPSAPSTSMSRNNRKSRK